MSRISHSGPLRSKVHQRCTKTPHEKFLLIFYDPNSRYTCNGRNAMAFPTNRVAAPRRGGFLLIFYCKTILRLSAH